MNIHIKSKNLDLTPSLRAYIDKKFDMVSKIAGKLDKAGVLEMEVEVARTTRHHHKGEVFYAEANLRLPGKLLRADHEDADIRAALDAVKDKLHMEIEKYKTKTAGRPRRDKRNV